MQSVSYKPHFSENGVNSFNYRKNGFLSGNFAPALKDKYELY
jgi:hypothetical protein